MEQLRQVQRHAVDLQDVPVFDRQAYTDRRPSRYFTLLHTSADEVEQFMQASETHQGKSSGWPTPIRNELSRLGLHGW
jgi:hypothetical protein